MTERWEYKSVTLTGTLEENDLTLNNLGAQGWNAYAVIDHDPGPYVVFLKRHPATENWHKGNRLTRGVAE